MSTLISNASSDQVPSSAPSTGRPRSGSMMSLVLKLLRPYRGWLVIVFAAMMVEIAMSLAAPWPPTEGAGA